MPPESRRPGFRLSPTDLVVVLLGIAAAAYGWKTAWWAGTTIFFVVGHFFLFCNVFRIPRKPELIWAGGFVMLVTVNLLTELQFPGWIATFTASLALSSFLIIRQLFLPGYHGVGWKRLNPKLIGWK